RGAGRSAVGALYAALRPAHHGATRAPQHDIRRWTHTERTVMQAKSLIPTSQRARLMVVTLAVAAVGVCASLAQAQPTAGPRAGEARHAMHGGPMGGRMLERALDS